MNKKTGEALKTKKTKEKRKRIPEAKEEERDQGNFFR